MQSYSLRHLPDHVLVQKLTAIVDQDRETTATLLAHIAEVDRRRLYAEAGYSSMFDYCVREFGFSEDMAAKRIRAARTSRRFPGILDAIADGRLHVTAVCLLAEPLRHLNASAGVELLVAAEHKTKEEIRVLLAERYPKPDMVARVRALAPEPTANCVVTQVPEPVEVQESSSEQPDGVDIQRGEVSATEAPQPCEDAAADAASVPTAPGASPSIAFEQVPSGRTTPLSPGRFGLQLTMSAETREKLQRVQDLLAPGVPRNDLALLLDRALDALIEKIERRRFGATGEPRADRSSTSTRHVPAAVRRAVTARDGGRCTFVSDRGKQCDARGDLEFDHITPVARGGESTIANLRLRCRAHNQLEAERTFGAGFMEAKRRPA